MIQTHEIRFHQSNCKFKLSGTVQVFTAKNEKKKHLTARSRTYLGGSQDAGQISSGVLNINQPKNRLACVRKEFKMIRLTFEGVTNIYWQSQQSPESENKYQGQHVKNKHQLLTGDGVGLVLSESHIRIKVRLQLQHLVGTHVRFYLQLRFQSVRYLTTK